MGRRGGRRAEWVDGAEKRKITVVCVVRFVCICCVCLLLTTASESDSEYDESKFVDKKKPVPKINNRKKQNKKTTVK